MTAAFTGFWVAYMGIEGGGALVIEPPTIPGHESQLSAKRAHSVVTE